MFLSLLLEQLRQEGVCVCVCVLAQHFTSSLSIYTGYSIFAVRGSLPLCEAHEILSACPVDPKDAAKLKVRMESLRPSRYDKSPSFDDVSSTAVEIDNDDLDDDTEEDYQLALAISASLQGSLCDPCVWESIPVPYTSQVIPDDRTWISHCYLSMLLVHVRLLMIVKNGLINGALFCLPS